MKLTHGQSERLYYALVISRESMAACNVPHDVRGVETNKIVNELLVTFAAGETFPESETEVKWKKRELHRWNYDSDELV